MRGSARAELLPCKDFVLGQQESLIFTQTMHLSKTLFHVRSINTYLRLILDILNILDVSTYAHMHIQLHFLRFIL